MPSLDFVLTVRVSGFHDFGSADSRPSWPLVCICLCRGGKLCAHSVPQR